MTGEAAAAAHVVPGTVLAGKYRVERVLGKGGVGIVVAAHHLQLDELVALKFLLPKTLDDPEADARFLREAQAAVKIKSEHVARVTDVGRLESGVPYMVMEYLDGLDLSKWLSLHGALPVAQAVDFVLQACEAIAEAHHLGIVHRDLKPANLFCIRRRDGSLSIKVLDFGISKVTTPGAQGHDMTRTTTVIGTPRYMSPEQLRASKTVDGRADIWSLGIILYELFTARTPFEADSIVDLAIMITTEPAVPSRESRSEVSAALEAVLTRCLAKDRASRFATVSELASALAPFGTRSASLSAQRIRGAEAASSPSFPALLPLSAAAAAPGIGAPHTMAAWGTTGGSSRPRRSAAFVAGIALLLACSIGAVAAFFLLRTSAVAVPGGVPSVAGAQAGALPPLPRASSVAVALPPPVGEITAPSLAESGGSAVPVTASAPPESAAPRDASASVPSGHRGNGRALGAHPTRADCSPPYTLDEQGRKHFKPQCYLGK